MFPLQGVLRRHDCSAHEFARVGLGLAALGNYHQAAFGVDNLEFVASAKHLALDAAAGNTEAIRSGLFTRMETIETDPEDLSDLPDRVAFCLSNTASLGQPWLPDTSHAYSK